MYALPSSGWMQVPIQEVGAADEPGGQVCTPPPQQEHKAPSIAQ